jgi:spermidine/putrescine transport system permease protein
MALYSFWTSSPTAVVVPILTLQNWRDFFGDPFYALVLLDTARLAVTTTIACVLIGYPTAYALSLLGPRWRLLSVVLLFLPSWISYVVRTMSWLYILGREGLINNLLLKLGLIGEPLPLLYNDVSVQIGLVHYLLPIVILNLYIGIQAVDGSLVSAARTLGANGWQTFVAITLPLSLPGVLAGALLCFILAAGSYLTPLILSGPGKTYYASLIYQLVIQQANWPSGATASLVFIVFLAAIAFVYTRWLGLANVFREVR